MCIGTEETRGRGEDRGLTMHGSGIFRQRQGSSEIFYTPASILNLLSSIFAPSPRHPVTPSPRHPVTPPPFSLSLIILPSPES